MCVCVCVCVCVSVCVSFAKPGNPASTLYNRVLNLVLGDFQALAFDNNFNPALKSPDVIESLCCMFAGFAKTCSRKARSEDPVKCIQTDLERAEITRVHCSRGQWCIVGHSALWVIVHCGS